MNHTPTLTIAEALADQRRRLLSIAARHLTIAGTFEDHGARHAMRERALALIRRAREATA